MQKSKLIALMLASSLAATGLSSCKDNDSSTNVEKSVDISPFKVIQKNDLKEDKIQEYENNLRCKSLTYNYSQEDIETILQDSYSYTEEQVIMAAYLNLKNHNLTIMDVYENLDNLLVQAREPRDITIDEMEYYYGKLNDICPIYTNPFMCYCALAINAHKAVCSEEHEPYFDVITCSYLEQKAEKDLALILKK